MAQPITLVVADDHPLYRAGVVDAIRERDDLELLATCSGGREALERILALRPQAALLDLRMRDLDGLDVLAELMRVRCPTRVVFLSAFEDGDLVHRAITGGAAGYLSKETDREDICEAIVAAAAGDIVVSPSLHTGVVRHLRRRSEPTPALAPREREVMRLTAQGLSGPQIATELGIQATTVKTHLKRAYRKLDVRDRAAMVAEAMRLGLLDVTLGLTDGPNAHFRIAALIRVAIIPLFLISETFFEQAASPADLPIVAPVMIVGVAYALITLVCAFSARRALPLAPFAVADIVLIGIICYGEGGTAADVHFAFAVPPFVAAFIGRPRDCAALAVLAIASYVASSVLHPMFGDGDSGRDVLVHGIDMVWRGGLAVVMSVILTRRADRIRNLAESRRALVTQALGAEAQARRELAYSLHDGLVQGLLSARQDLKAARRGRPGYLDRAETTLEQAVDELRSEIFELHPHQLENGGLASALVAVAERLAPPGGRPAVVAVVPAAAHIDDELAFAIGRELMTNASRHADASSIALTVTLERGRLVVCCEDDGRGIDAARRAEAVATGHIGLAACTERVEALGGRLLVDSAPGRGTRVRAEIPAAAGLRRSEPAPPAGREPVPVAG